MAGVERCYACLELDIVLEAEQGKKSKGYGESVRLYRDGN